jgi:hypothetical protein
MAAELIKITPRLISTNNCITPQAISKMSLEALSTELQQGILGYLDIISLLNIKHTSKIWRDRVNNALSKTNIILPARARLLELYLELPHRPSIPPYDIEPFLGEEYLSNLRAVIAQHAPNPHLGIPLEFELWILEWPHAAPGGFTFIAKDCGYGEDGGIGCTDPNRMLLTFRAKEDTPMVGIFVSSHGCQDYSILFFDAGKESDGVVWQGDICEMEEIDDWDADEILADSWVDWLRMEL